MTVKVALVAWEAQPKPPDVAEKVRALGVEFVEQDCASTREAVALAADAEIVWVMGGWKGITAEALPELHRCGAIIRSGSGTDNIPVAAATERNILVCNTPEGPALGVAEHTVALLLAVTREITKWDRIVRDGGWVPGHDRPRFVLSGKTLGLIGFGVIARNVAKRLKAFNLRIIAHDPGVAAEVFAAHEVAAVSLDQLYGEADFISVHCPLLPSTQNLIGAAALEKMKPTAILINTARGGIVDSAALARALDEGRIAGAGLAVLDREPPPADHPLLHARNVTLTAHVAGYHDRMFDDFWRLSIETVADLARGRYPASVVNPRVKPRWPLAPRGGA